MTTTAREVIQECIDSLKEKMHGRPASSEVWKECDWLLQRFNAALRSTSAGNAPSRADIMGAVARGWCSPNNAGKEVDAELAFAITVQVMALLEPAALARNADQRAQLAQAIERERLANMRADQAEEAYATTLAGNAPSGEQGTLAVEDDEIAIYTRTDGHREWCSVGSWLYPGDAIVLRRQPRAAPSLPNAEEQRDEKGRPMTYWGGLAIPTRAVPTDLHDKAMALPSIHDLRDVVKLPQDNATHIANLENCYRDARQIVVLLLASTSSNAVGTINAEAQQVPATATNGVGIAEADSLDNDRLEPATSVQAPIASPAAASAPSNAAGQSSTAYPVNCSFHKEGVGPGETASAAPSSTDQSWIADCLRLAIKQNSHDMLLTGDEIRRCEAALASFPSSTAAIEGDSDAEVERRAREWDKLHAAIGEYVESYEWRGHNGDYTPTAREKALMYDVIAGLWDGDVLDALCKVYPVRSRFAPSASGTTSDDSARMNWLEQKRAGINYYKPGVRWNGVEKLGAEVEWEAGPNDIRFSDGKTLREAIDVAMSCSTESRKEP